MARGSDMHERVAGDDEKSELESPNRAADQSRIADAIERNATATERIFIVLLVMFLLSIIGMAAIVFHWIRLTT